MLTEACSCCAARFITLLPTSYLSIFTIKLNKKFGYSISNPNSLFSLAPNGIHGIQNKNKISIYFSLLTSGYRGYRCVPSKNTDKISVQTAHSPRTPDNVVTSFHHSVANKPPIRLFPCACYRFIFADNIVGGSGALFLFVLSHYYSSRSFIWAQLSKLTV